MTEQVKQIEKSPFISEEKFNAMFGMQHERNDEGNPGWLETPPNYAFAIATEAVEGFNYTNWEWWRHQDKREINFPQMHMEIVDIWYSLMSEVMTHKLDPGITYYAIFEAIDAAMVTHRPKDFAPTVDQIRMSFMNLINSATSLPSPGRVVGMVTAFSVLLDVSGLGWDNLYKMYIGKSTLITFRQDHGYSKNTDQYRDIWETEVDRKQDNEYLIEILDTISEVNPDTKTNIYKALEAKYDGFKSAKKDSVT